jgi:IclR family transcriptional regulator, KDG regulon repressor
VSRGYLERSGERAHGFSLGLRAFEVGSAYAARLDLTREGRRIAMELVAASGETVSVTVLEGTDVVYLVTVESTQAVRAVTVGRMPAHCTASGKAQLACLSREEVDRRYAGGERLTASTPNTITSLERLHRELDEVRVRGVAIDDEEAHLNQRCVAATVFGHDGAAVAALTISAPAMRVEGEELQRFIALARRGAVEYSRRLGHRAGAVGS